MIYKEIRLIIIFLLIGINYSCDGNKEHTSINSNNVENFNNFYKRFTTDSLFQLERIKFPLTGVYLDGETVGINPVTGEDNTGDTVWTSKTWNIIHAINEEDKKSLDFSINQHKDTMIVLTKGIDYGFYFEEKYLLYNNKWYLIYLKDISL